MVVLKCRHPEGPTSPACPRAPPTLPMDQDPISAPLGPWVPASAMPQQCRSPAPPHACAWPWAPLAWTLTTGGLTSQPGLGWDCHYGLTPRSRGCVSPRLPSPGLTLLHLPSLTSDQPRHRSRPGQGAAPSCYQPALHLHWGWWDGPWVVRSCHASPRGESSGPMAPHCALVWRTVAERAEPGSCHSWAAQCQEAAVARCSWRTSSRASAWHFPPEGWWALEQDAWGGRGFLCLQIFKTWQDKALSKPLWLWSLSCFEQEVGLDELQTSFRTWTVLWFCG